VGDCQLGKFESQSALMIAVGHCPNSNSIQFYNPANGAFVSSIDYKFQHNVTAGSQFGYKYQSGMFLYRLDESTHIFAPQYNLDTNVYVHTHSPPSVAKIIGILTYNAPNIYTVVYPDGSISEYTADLLSAAPTTLSNYSSLPPWIKGGTDATLFLHQMSKPRHGKLRQLVEDNWVFLPGKTIKNGIPLPNLLENCHQLLESGQLFKGHVKFKTVYDRQNQGSLRDCILHHVSAYGLKSLVAPTSLKSHANIDLDDKIIWDAAYDEEYDGLMLLPTWEVVSEDQFRQLNNGKRALPTMAIATIKYDKNNKPIPSGSLGKFRLSYLV
jgi:hypothetical protein